MTNKTKKRIRATGRKNLVPVFDRPIPPILLKPMVWRYAPGKAPVITNDGDIEVEPNPEQTKAELAKRLFALCDLLGIDSETWILDPERLLMLLAQAVFPGFRTLYQGTMERNENKKLYPLNPLLLRWYQRSVQLRLEGLGLHKAVKQAAKEFREMKALTEESVIKHWQKAARGGLVRMSEDFIAERGLERGAKFILGLPAELLDAGAANPPLGK